MESFPSPPTSGQSSTGLQVKQGSDLGPPKFEHCFRWPLSAASPVLRITLVSASSVSYGVPETASILAKSVCPKYAQDTARRPGRGQCCSLVQENDWALPPVSPKFGHCPRVFQRTGRCPGTLGTALGSCSPSATSTALHRSSPAFLLGSSAPADATLGLAVSSPWRAPCASALQLRLRATGYLAASPQGCCRAALERDAAFSLGGRAPLGWVPRNTRHFACTLQTTQW